MQFVKNTLNKIGALYSSFLKFSLGKKIIVIAIVGLAVWFVSTKLVAQKSSSSQYQTAAVQKGTIISTVNESGNVTSSSQAGVGSPTTGIVDEIYVKDGDEVVKGQNLFKVKSTATPQEQAQALASYLSAQNNLNDAQSKIYSLQAALFKANQTFINDKGIPNPDDIQKTDPVYVEENANWLHAEADYKNQQTAVSAAQASLNSASLSYQTTQDSVIPAPFDGTVANIGVKPGDQVTASAGNLSSNISSSSNSSSSSNNAILYIGNYSTPYVKVQASEVDITSIKPDQKATVTLSAFPDKTFVGTVDQVDTAGTITTGVVTYNVYITLVSPPEEIKPGMSASVTIQIARKDDVLSVPTAAVQTASGTPTVRVLKNGQVSVVDVTTGISSDTDTEITSGLTEGQTVVTGITAPATTAGGAAASPFSGLGGGRAGFGGGNAVFRSGAGGGR